MRLTQNIRLILSVKYAAKLENGGKKQKTMGG